MLLVTTCHHFTYCKAQSVAQNLYPYKVIRNNFRRKTGFQTFFILTKKWFDMLDGSPALSISIGIRDKYMTQTQGQT